MAILYGTTGDGTTLPVLVDQFGNLLAKGIDGEPGPPGEDGAPGPPGPPGIGQLPDDPYEGAILGWQDGELAWIGGSVPLPEGTYGPYTYDSGGALEVPQDVGHLIYGQQLVMTDATGIPISINIETSTITNIRGKTLTFETDKDLHLLMVGDTVQPGVTIVAIDSESDPPTVTVSGGSWLASDGTGIYTDNRYFPSQSWTSRCSGNPYSGTYYFDKAFDGNLTTRCTPADGKSILFSLPADQAINCYESFQYYQGVSSASSACYIQINSSDSYYGGNVNFPSTPNQWKDLPVPANNKIQSMWWNRISGSSAIDICAIKVDGMLLLDGVPGNQLAQTKITRTNVSGTGSVQSTIGNTIILRENNKEWIDGFYVTAPEQRIAARNVAAAAIKKKTN